MQTQATRSLRAIVFTLSFDPESQSIDDSALREFVETVEVVGIHPEWVRSSHGPQCHCLVVYRGAPASVGPANTGSDAKPRTRDRPTERRRTGSSHPAESLNSDQRAVYEALRAWRIERSREDGVPPYVLLKNRQLAELATRRPTSLAALQEIDGIGPKKASAFGAELLTLLTDAPPAEVQDRVTPAEEPES